MYRYPIAEGNRKRYSCLVNVRPLSGTTLTDIDLFKSDSTPPQAFKHYTGQRWRSASAPLALNNIIVPQPNKLSNHWCHRCSLRNSIPKPFTLPVSKPNTSFVLQSHTATYTCLDHRLERWSVKWKSDQFLSHPFIFHAL